MMSYNFRDGGLIKSGEADADTTLDTGIGNTDPDYLKPYEYTPVVNEYWTPIPTVWDPVFPMPYSVNEYTTNGGTADVENKNASPVFWWGWAWGVYRLAEPSDGKQVNDAGDVQDGRKYKEGDRVIITGL